METKDKPLYNICLVLLIALVMTEARVSAQTVKERLEQRIDHTVTAAAPLDQLLEVAKRFKIPMAIEWLEGPNSEMVEKREPVKVRNQTAAELITAIVRQRPDQHVVFEDRVVRVFAPAAFYDRRNFMNFRVGGFCVAQESLFGSECDLRLDIKMTLYPERYRNGYAGGCGGGWPHSFWDPDITLCGDHLTVRKS